MIEKDKFNIKEAFNNGEGQTASAIIGAFLLIVVGCVSFLWSVFEHYHDALPYCVSFAGLGSGIFGVRAIKNK